MRLVSIDTQERLARSRHQKEIELPGLKFKILQSLKLSLLIPHFNRPALKIGSLGCETTQPRLGLYNFHLKITNIFCIVMKFSSTHKAFYTIMNSLILRLQYKYINKFTISKEKSYFTAKLQ